MQVRDRKFRHNFSHENLKRRVHRVDLIIGIIITTTLKGMQRKGKCRV